MDRGQRTHPQWTEGRGTNNNEDSEEEWLQDICRAPRRSLHQTPSDASDDNWIHELCRGTQCPAESAESTTPPAIALQSSSGVPAIELPIAASQRGLKRIRSQSPLSHSHPSPLSHITPFAGPYICMDELVSELRCHLMPLPSPPWIWPEQDGILWSCTGVQPPSSGTSTSTAYQLPSAGVPALRRCLWRIAAWSATLGVCVFKVGIAYDPVHRWSNPEFGYDTEGQWMFMDVMHAGPAQEMRQLEIDLIHRLRQVPGCHNHSPGGEGISASGSSTSSLQCHCYTVFAPAGSGVGLHITWGARKRMLTYRRGPVFVPGWAVQ